MDVLSPFISVFFSFRSESCPRLDVGKVSQRDHKSRLMLCIARRTDIITAVGVWRVRLLCYSAHERSIVMSVSVCAFVCPRSYLRNYTSDLHQYFVRVTYDRGSVLFWRRSHTLRTSGFTDDIIFAHKLRLLDVAAQLKRTSSLGLVYKVRAVISVAGQRTHRTAFGALKVTSQVATPGAESAVYDCMVLLAENATPKSTRSELNAFSRSCARLQTTAANDPTNCRLHPTNR